MRPERVAHFISHPTDVFHHEESPTAPPYEALGDDPSLFENFNTYQMNEGVIYTINKFVNNAVNFVNENKKHLIAAGTGAAIGALLTSELTRVTEKQPLKSPSSI